MKKAATYILILFLLLVSLRFIWITSAVPLLVYGDSSIYLELAQNLIHGNGYRVWDNGRHIPYFFFPPQYPLTLAALQKFTGLTSALEAARWIALLSLFITLIFIYKTFRLLKIKKCIGFIFLFLLVNSWIYPLYYIVLSEHLFLMLFAIHLFLFTRWFLYRKKSDLILLGLIGASMFLTRYAAIGIILPTALVIGWRSSRHAFFSLVLYLFPFVITAAIWQIISRFHTNGLYGRELHWHPPGIEHIKSIFITFINWITPGLTRYLFIPFLLILGAAYLWGRRKSDEIRKPIMKTYLTGIVFLAFSYLLFILVTISLFDFTTPLDTRMLAPFYFYGIVSIAFFLQNTIRSSWLYPLLGLLVLSHAVFGIQDARSRLNGGYALRTVNSPELLRFIRRTQGKIYSNAKDLILPVKEDHANLYDLPCRYNRMTLEPKPDYKEKLKKIRREIEEGKASIIFFEGFLTRNFEIPEDELFRIMEGITTYRFPESRAVLFTRLYKEPQSDSVPAHP